jgi:hypothetical protein
MPSGLDLLLNMEELIMKCARDENGMFEHHAFCAWCLVPFYNHEDLFAMVHNLLVPGDHDDLYFDVFLRLFISEFSHEMDLNEETRLVLVEHVTYMFEHRVRK